MFLVLAPGRSGDHICGTRGGVVEVTMTKKLYSSDDNGDRGRLAMVAVFVKKIVDVVDELTKFHNGRHGKGGDWSVLFTQVDGGQWDLCLHCVGGQ